MNFLESGITLDNPTLVPQALWFLEDQEMNPALPFPTAVSICQ